MRPVERRDERVQLDEVGGQDLPVSRFWMYPATWQTDVYNFPAGPFTVASAILGGVVNFWTGNLVFRLFSLQQPALLFFWIVLGIGIGIGAAIKFINWLIDHSPD